MSDTSLSSEDEGELLYSDEDQPHPPGYGATHSRAPYLQHVATNTGNAEDSDVDLINVGSESPVPLPSSNGANPAATTSTTTGAPASSSRQPVVNFEGSTVQERRRARDSGTLRDYKHDSRDNAKNYYDDFHTIDWVRDRNRDRLRHKKLNRDRRISWRGCGRKVWDAGSGWLIVFLVGVSSGLLAGVIDVAAEWMSDLKEGVCPHAAYYNHESCCWFNNATDFTDEDNGCKYWKNWALLAGVDSGTGSYIFNYFIYIFLTVGFAGLAGLYVTTLAPYAAGSGIPEVKTILSGFIIRGYLGAWTLLVKSVGMVLAVGAGLSLGKEGPLVHVACCCGNLFTRLFPKYYQNEAKKREVLSAAAAAGVSVAFGAPVGGVLFSLEDYYDDFHTIDWVRDRNRDRLRHKKLNRDRRISWRGCGRKVWDAGSGWLIVFLVGVSSGLLAGVIDVAAEWMSDLKEGVCPHAAYYNHESCCWFNNATDFTDEDNGCKYWKNWALLAGVDSGTGSYIFNYFIYIFLTVGFAGLAGLYVTTLAPYAAGSGIPEVKTILSGFIIRGYLGAWTLLVKSVGMVLAVGAGLSLGKEGPLVHVACCCGNLFTRLFPKYYQNEAKKREVLSAAAAAGVSVAFGAPVGGVLFSLEEVSYYFPHKVMWRAFFAALTAAFTLQLMNPYFSGHLVLFYANYDHQWHLFEFIPFIFIGLFGGVYGAAFIKLNILWTKLRRRYFKKFPIPIIEVLIVALVTALIAFPNIYTRSNASEVIRMLFSQCGPEDNNDLCQYNWTISHTQTGATKYYDTQALDGVGRAVWMLLLALLAKGVLTIFTFGMQVPAGLFIPSMFVGACMGRVVGIGMEQLAYVYRDSGFFRLFCSDNEACVTPGLYAMIGAAACLGGVTRMTVSLVVIMFELTGGLTYIVPIMVAVMISKWVGDALVSDGIYDAHIHLYGYPFLDSKQDFTHNTMACDVMRPQRTDPPLSVVDLSDVTMGRLEGLLRETEFFGFPCVLSKDSQLLAGFLTRKDMQYVLDQVAGREEGVVTESRVFFSENTRRVAQQLLESEVPSVNFRGLMDPSPFQISDQTPMETVVEMFRKMGLRQVLISHNGRLLGIITKKDVLKHIAELEHKDPSTIRFH